MAKIQSSTGISNNNVLLLSPDGNAHLCANAAEVGAISGSKDLEDILGRIESIQARENAKISDKSSENFQN